MNRNLPPLTAIKAFEAAARHESYRAASAELHVTPTAISQQVVVLEQYLDTKLFTRMSNGLRLTNAGKSLLPSLTESLNLIADAALEVRREKLKGSVKIGVLPAMAVNWLIPNLSSFNAKFPDLTLSVHTTPDMTTIQAEEMDITIDYCKGQFEDKTGVLLCDEVVFPICSPKLIGKMGGLTSIRDIEGFPLIHDIDGRRTQPWLGWKHWSKKMRLNINLARHPGFEFRDSISVMHATVAGLGVAIGRSALIGGLLESGQLVRPFKIHSKANFSYYIVVSNDRVEEPKIKAVIEWLKSISHQNE